MKGGTIPPRLAGHPTRETCNLHFHPSIPVWETGAAQTCRCFTGLHSPRRFLGFRVDRETNFKKEFHWQTVSQDRAGGPEEPIFVGRRIPGPWCPFKRFLPKAPERICWPPNSARTRLGPSSWSSNRMAGLVQFGGCLFIWYLLRCALQLNDFWQAVFRWLKGMFLRPRSGPQFGNGCNFVLNAHVLRFYGQSLP